MRTLPTRDNARGTRFTVADFYEAGRERLRLELVAGSAGLEHPVNEPIVNRPGLALTGFFPHFAPERIQLVGHGESAYLDSLAPDERLTRLMALVEKGAYCFVYTNGACPRPEEIRRADAENVVLLTTPLETRVFANQSAFLLEHLAAPSTTLYGTMVEVGGLGVLFEGEPGLGKSETALGLVKRGSALVADDLTCIRKDVSNDILYGSAADSTAGYMEIRGIGIMHIPSVFGITAVRGEKRLELVITFRHLKEMRGDIDRIGQRRKFRTILGVDVPNVIIPVSEGRDLVNLVETAAQQQKLILSGYDPVQSLSDRLRARADGKSVIPALRPEKQRKGRSNGRQHHA